MMRKFLQMLLIIGLFQLSHAQLRILDLSNVTTSGLKLEKKWLISDSQEEITFKNGIIKNSGPKQTDFKIEFYLMSIDTQLNESTQAYYLDAMQFNSIKRNENLTNISLTTQFAENMKDGNYFPLVLLKKGDTIVDVQQLNRLVKLGEEPKQEIVTKTQIFTNEDKKFALIGNWDLEIDFKNFMVDITGKEMANYGNNDASDLVLEVFLTTQQFSEIPENFNGVLIATAPIDKVLNKNQSFYDVQVKTNLVNIPPNGTYNILYTLSTQDTEGKQIVRAKKVFEGTLSF